MLVVVEYIKHIKRVGFHTMFRGYIYESDENVYYQNVIILQMILTSKEDYVIAELINKEDFEKYFEGVNKI